MTPAAVELSGQEVCLFYCDLPCAIPAGAPKEQPQALTQLFSQAAKARVLHCEDWFTIAHRLVEAMGGSMAMSSEPQRGRYAPFPSVCTTIRSMAARPHTLMRYAEGASSLSRTMLPSSHSS
jgi:hypothetical protein